MPLSKSAAVDQVRSMIEWRNGEKQRLDRLHKYLSGKQERHWLSSGVPAEVRSLAEMSSVNVTKFIVDSAVQSMYVDGYRAPRQSDDEPAWELWQRNRMDARQVGVHRAALGYGASYVTVLPGEPVPVLRGASPRKMTTVYGQDDDWPMWALEARRTTSGRLWRLFDETHVYWVGDESKRIPGAEPKLEFIESEAHGVGVVPVVRFRDTHDLDDEVIGVIEPITDLQDQLDLTTFSLLVAQHYGAFKQRYVLGWMADSEAQALKTSAAKFMMWEDHPDDIEVGQFDETDLAGYIESREATLRHAATISQTPVHELVGQMVNLSAEALVAARESHNRRLGEHKTVIGESWEQVFELGGYLLGEETDPKAWVRWRDVEARSLAQTADALGKLVQMLGVPPQELWERVPGVTQQEIERWKAARAEGDALGNLTALLETQMADAGALA